MTADPPREHEVAELLTGDRAGGVLDAATRAAGATLTDWSLRSVHHRAGRSLSAVYEARLDVAGEDQPVLLVAHSDTRPLPDGAFVVSGDRHDIAVWRFPNDPFLPGLRSAVHRARVRELLDRLDGPPGDVALRTRAYRPARRAVVEVTVHGGPAEGRVLYLKVLAGTRAAEVADLHRQLTGVLPVPAVIGVAARQGIVALEALGGATLRSALVAGDPVPEPDDLVELTARLARTRLTSRRDPGRFADPTRHVDLLRGLVPDTAPALDRAAAAAAEVGGPVGAVHGDLHDAQILVEDGAIVGILDVDGAGTGRIAWDLGGLVAHLEVVGEVWPDASARAAGYAAGVATAATRLVGARDLARATAGAWLGLATGPYRAQDDGWRQATRRRVARADAWARRAAAAD